MVTLVLEIFEYRIKLTFGKKKIKAKPSGSGMPGSTLSSAKDGGGKGSGGTWGARG